MVIVTRGSAEPGNKLFHCIKTLSQLGVTTFLIPNYYYFILTHHSDPIAFDSFHMTYLLQAQLALLRFTAELSQLILLLDYSSHDYSALLIMTHYA